MAAAGHYVVFVSEKASLMSTNSSQRRERERHRTDSVTDVAMAPALLPRTQNDLID